MLLLITGSLCGRCASEGSSRGNFTFSLAVPKLGARQPQFQTARDTEACGHFELRSPIQPGLPLVISAWLSWHPRFLALHRPHYFVLLLVLLFADPDFFDPLLLPELDESPEPLPAGLLPPDDLPELGSSGEMLTRIEA